MAEPANLKKWDTFSSITSKDQLKSYVGREVFVTNKQVTGPNYPSLKEALFTEGEEQFQGFCLFWDKLKCGKTLPPLPTDCPNELKLLFKHLKTWNSIDHDWVKNGTGKCYLSLLLNAALEALEKPWVPRVSTTNDSRNDSCGYRKQPNVEGIGQLHGVVDVQVYTPKGHVLAIGEIKSGGRVEAGEAQLLAALYKHHSMHNVLPAGFLVTGDAFRLYLHEGDVFDIARCTYRHSDLKDVLLFLSHLVIVCSSVAETIPISQRQDQPSMPRSPVEHTDRRSARAGLNTEQRNDKGASAASKE